MLVLWCFTVLPSSAIKLLLISFPFRDLLRLQALSIESVEIDSYSLDVVLCKSKKRQIYLPRSILQSATKQNKINPMSIVQCPFFLLVLRATYPFMPILPTHLVVSFRSLPMRRAEE